MRGVGRGRRETEMDGVKSVAVQGRSYRETQSTDAQRRSRRGFGKMTSQEVGEGGIMSKEGEDECICTFVCERDRGRPGGRRRGKSEVYRREFGEERKKRVPRNPKINTTPVGEGDHQETNQTSSARSSPSTPFKMVALF